VGCVHRFQHERRRRFTDQRRVDRRRIFAEAEEEDGYEGERDGHADDEDGAVHASSCAPSSGTSAVRVTATRFGTRAITPPTPISSTASQIHDTIGLISIITETVWADGSMFVIDR